MKDFITNIFLFVLFLFMKIVCLVTLGKCHVVRVVYKDSFKVIV